MGAVMLLFKMRSHDAVPESRSGPFDRIFDVTLAAKAVDGLLEVAGGLLLWLVKPDRVSTLLRDLTQHELIHGRNDLIAHHMGIAAGHVTAQSQSFAAVFLLWHGLVKVLLVWALLRRYLWAYPIGIAAFGAFLVYQLYRYTHTHSPWLLALSALDLAVVVLTVVEYRRLLEQRPALQ